jgi:peptidoglycan pentaglycine glycine transferase (the first glycine)
MYRVERSNYMLHFVDPRFIVGYRANPQQYILHTFSAEQQIAPRLIEEWDQFVNEHPNGHLLQSWGWGELKASVGWHPLRLALWDMHCQKIVAVAQVLRRGITHIPLRAGHLAYIPKGPVLDWSQPSQPEAFLSQLNTQLRRQGALALRIEPPLCTGMIHHAPADVPLRPSVPSPFTRQMTALQFHPAPAIQPLRTILLDLTDDEETLLARMKEKWRYNVRLATRKGVTVREAHTVEDVQAWYRLLQTTSERDHFGVHTLDYYLQAWRIFVPRGQMRLLIAEYNGQLLAGIFVGLMARQAIYLYGASSNELRHLMPNYLLQWEAMRWAKQQGALQYDLWGIPETDDEHEAMSGVYRFKSGWGGEVVRFVGNYECLYHPLLMRLARKLLSI